MRYLQRAAIVALAMFVAIGGALGSVTALAQEEEAEEVEVAQPDGELEESVDVELVQIADGLVDPINVTSAPGDTDRIYVVERTGTIQLFIDGEMQDEPFLDISELVKIDFLEAGLLSVAFHPEYEDNGRFFVFYTDWRTNGDTTVAEYAVSEDDENVADPESANVILTEHSPFVNHNGGTMRFGPDGYLYISIGDGGMAGDPYNNAQDLTTFMGKLLRIDVDVDVEGQAYGIPEDNPFAPGGVMQSEQANQIAQTGEYNPAAKPEIWAYGLRNAWQFSFDQETGDLYIADVGQYAWEEINFQEADAGGGQNYGWPFMEASHVYPPPEDVVDRDPPAEDTRVGVLPVAEYDHDRGDCSITGLGVYRGESSPELDGIYFASDYCSGNIYGLEQADNGEWNFEWLLEDTGLLVSGAGQTDDGELYITACDCVFGRDYDPFDDPSGTVWQLVSAEAAEEMNGETVEATPADENDEDEDEEEEDDEDNGNDG